MAKLDMALCLSREIVEPDPPFATRRVAKGGSGSTRLV